MRRSFSSLPVFFLVAAVVLVLDQASKIAVVESGLVGPTGVIPGLLELLYRENRGGAWGLLAGASESFRMPFFVGTSLLAIVFLVWLRKKMIVHRPWAHLAFPAVLGGAVGNLVDRVRLGYVVDFIDVHVGGAHWPTFNVADVGITVGVIALVADSIFVPRGAVEPAAPGDATPGLGGVVPSSVDDSLPASADDGPAGAPAAGPDAAARRASDTVATGPSSAVPPLDAEERQD